MREFFFEFKQLQTRRDNRKGRLRTCVEGHLQDESKRVRSQNNRKIQDIPKKLSKIDSERAPDPIVAQLQVNIFE